MVQLKGIYIIICMPEVNLLQNVTQLKSAGRTYK